MTKKNNIIFSKDEIFHLNRYNKDQDEDDDDEILHSLFQKASKRLEQNTHMMNKPTKCFWVPGRIELVGKHTDYAGGQSLICATDHHHGFAVVTSSRKDSEVHIFTFYDGKEQSIVLDLNNKNSTSATTAGQSLSSSSWIRYPSVTIQRLKMNFPDEIKNGANIAVESNLPPASGMSSSSAIICYMFMVMDYYNSLRSSLRFQTYIPTDQDMYTYLGNIENGKDFIVSNCSTTSSLDNNMCLPGTCGGVGTFGGSEDHTAIMSGKLDQIRWYKYCPTKHIQTIDLSDPNVVFVICVSGARAEKTGNVQHKYNNASHMATWAAATYSLSLLLIMMKNQDEKSSSRNDLQNSLQQQKLDTNTIQNLFHPSTGTLSNAKLPNLSEVIRNEYYRQNVDPAYIMELEESNNYFSNEKTRQFHSTILHSIQNCMKTTESIYKDYIPKLFELEEESCPFCMDDLVNRLEQFYYENQVIVPGVARSFVTKDYCTLGKLVDWSHDMTVNLLQNTLPETEWLPKWARGLLKVEKKQRKDNDRVYALAASAFGAGFGGACWALVRKEEAQLFQTQWRSGYESAFPQSLINQDSLPREFFIMRPGNGAHSFGNE